MDDESILNDMPMHYGYYRVNYDCTLPDDVIENEIPEEVKKASTFGELYESLCKMKMDLESEETIESVEIEMDVPDTPGDDNSEVMLKLNIEEKKGFSPYLICDSSLNQNDYVVGVGGDIFNPTQRMDVIQATDTYSILRGDREQSIVYKSKYSPLHCPISFRFWKGSINRLRESSVKVYSSGIGLIISDFKKRFHLEFGSAWRDLAPFGDKDELRVLKTQCSGSMLKECRPSLKTTFGLRYHYDSRDDRNHPTEGSLVDLYLGYNGFIGDVNSVKAECDFQTNIALTNEIDQEAGLLLHLRGFGGIIRNLNRRNTRYVDRFFLDKTYVRGTEIRDFGPKSAPEDGGRQGGDALGGDCCAAVSAALSLPVVVSNEYNLGIRTSLFYEVGNVWNYRNGLANVWNSSQSVYGVDLNIPVGRVNVNLGYLMNKKRFTFGVTLD